MPRIFALLVSALLFILGVGFVLVQMLRFLGISRMSRNRRNRERLALLAHLKSLNIDRAPWTKNEVDLLSARVETKAKKRFFSKSLEGYAQTIYSEPLLPFAASVYSSNQYILCFTTNKQNYTLMALGKVVEAFVGDQKVGAFHRNDLVVNGKVLASIQRERGTYKTIMVEGKDLGHINTNVKSDRVTERKMEMVMDGAIDGQNMALFTLLLGYDLFSTVIDGQ